jgi:hypothetical protein
MKVDIRAATSIDSGKVVLSSRSLSSAEDVRGFSSQEDNSLKRPGGVMINTTAATRNEFVSNLIVSR